MTTGPPANPLRVVIVGPCASGKTTLADGLKREGLEAVVCGQEHSEIPTLWRHSEPDVLIMLMVALETIRSRRGADWPESIYKSQLERLKHAKASADLIIDTSSTTAVDTLEAALTFIRRG